MRYSTLSFMRAIIGLVGVVLLMGGLAVLLAGTVAFTSGEAQSSTLPFLIGGGAGVLLGLPFLVLMDLIQLAIDVEANTRATAEYAAEAAEALERLASTLPPKTK